MSSEPRTKRRTRSASSTSSRRGASEVDAFARFCAHLTLEDGSAVALEPFQRVMLGEFFAGAVESVILIPKKNGKSTLLALLALYHLVTTPDAECVVAAASRDQAAILFGQAAGFVRRSPALQQRIRPTMRELRSRRDSGRIRVLASDVDTADGVIPTLALVDELHRHKSADLYGVFRDGLGPRNGRMITISTAGADTGSPLGELRRIAHELPRKERVGAHLRALSEDGAFVLHEWALTEDEDVHDMGVVKVANPASWQTEAALSRRHDSPSMTPWQWARFACGIWTAAEEPWIDPAAWDACYEPNVAISDGAEVVLGVDIGRKHDHTAVVALHRRGDKRVVVSARVFVPPDHDDSLDLAEVERHISELAKRFRVVGVVYDPWSFERSAQLLSDQGLTLIEHPQSPERMHKASALLFEGIHNQTLVHDGDRTLTAHVQAGASKDTERGWRLVKNPKLKRPIDALIALAVAFTEFAKPPVSGGFEW